MKRVRSSDSFDLAPQMKRQISEKEVNLGVHSNQLMQKVYEKTLKFLKEGAKIESPNSKLDKYIGSWINKRELNGQVGRHHLRQMVLDKNMKLQVSENHVDKVPLIDMCDCGQVIDSINCTSCRFCNQPLCLECTAECSACSQTFCKECSLSVYDQEDHQMCIDCFSSHKR